MVFHRWSACWVLVGAACGDGGSGSSGPDGSSSGDTTAATTGASTSAATTADDADTTAASEATTGGGSSGGSSDESTGGGLEEGPFASSYRLVFTVRHTDPAFEAVWVDVDDQGASTPSPVLPDGVMPIVWSASPSGRWMVVRAATESAGEGWIVDTTKLGDGDPAQWAWDLGVSFLGNAAFEAGETGVAYGASQPLDGFDGVLARSLGDAGPGPAQAIGPDGFSASTTALTIEADVLVFQATEADLYLAPADPLGAPAIHAADIVDAGSQASRLWVSPDGSAAYLSAQEACWLVDLDAALPTVATPMALPDDVGGVRVFTMSGPRNRLLIADVAGDGTPSPLHYLVLEGTSVSAPYPVPLPLYEGGAVVTRSVFAADGTHAWVVATVTGDPRVGLHRVELDADGNATASEIAGPNVDGLGLIPAIDVSADEQRVYYAAQGLTRSIQVVDAEGSAAPLDLAPGYEWHVTDQSPPVVESADGRAVYFMGFGPDRPELSVFRIGVVEGEFTAPVAMGTPAVAEQTLSNLSPAPDGGGIAYALDDRLMFSMFADGEPTAAQLTADGDAGVWVNTVPMFVTSPR